MRIHSLPLLLTTLLLTACWGAPPPEPPEEDIPVASSSSSESIAETHNVIFTGRVQPAGVSIFMEGTHRLLLPDGRFILLQSETVDLNGYVGEEAEVMGAVRPTVEQGGTIMRVEQIRLLESSSFSSSSSAESSSLSASSASSVLSIAAQNSSVTILVSSASSVSSSSITPQPVSSTTSSRASSQVSSSTSAPATTSMWSAANVASMAKQNLDAANWTQAYCTSHIGFCIPIHRNWWFKSFGAASPSLWHLEVSAAEITNMGDGPLSVDLLSGFVGTKSAADGEVRVSGDQVIGYKEWTENRHFEIRAPAELQAAVTYMVQHLTPMEQQ